MPIDDLNHQRISSVKNKAQGGPKTITAAATIAPDSLITIVSGTTAVATITPPVSGEHTLVVVASTTNFSGFVTTGNILVASVTNSTVWDNRATIFAYNPLTGKYYANYPVAGTNF